MKEAVLPFNRFPEVDTILGPEMRSTGEVMGIDRTFGMAFAKSQAGAGNKLPRQGTVFLSLADRDKDAGLVAAGRFAELGFSIAATAGTARLLEDERRAGRHGRRQGRRGRRASTRSTSSRRARSTSWSTRHAAAGRAPTACTSAGPRSSTASPASRPSPRPSRRRRASPRRPSATPEVRSLQEYHADGQLRFEV